MSILVNKNKTQTRTLSVRIPGALADDLDALRADADRAGYSIDVSGIVAAALIKALRDARAELADTTPSTTSRKQNPTPQPATPADPA